MRNEYDANRSLSETPKRRVNPNWVPPRTYIGLMDVMFVGAAFLAATWFLAEYGGEVWSAITERVIGGG